MLLLPQLCVSFTSVRATLHAVDDGARAAHPRAVSRDRPRSSRRCVTWMPPRETGRARHGCFCLRSIVGRDGRAPRRAFFLAEAPRDGPAAPLQLERWEWLFDRQRRAHRAAAPPALLLGRGGRRRAAVLSRGRPLMLDAVQPPPPVHQPQPVLLGLWERRPPVRWRAREMAATRHSLPSDRYVPVARATSEAPTRSHARLSLGSWLTGRIASTLAARDRARQAGDRQRRDDLLTPLALFSRSRDAIGISTSTGESSWRSRCGRLCSR